MVMETSVRLLFDKIRQATNPEFYKVGPAGERAPLKSISRGTSVEKAISDFRSRLEELRNRHNVKHYQPGYLVGQCYGRNRRLQTDTEKTAYCRAHFRLAILCFDDLINNMRGSKKNIPHTILKSYADTIADYLFDLKPIIEYLERKRDPHYVFFEGHSSRSPMSWEILRLSRQLALQSIFKGTSFHMDHKTAQIASTFVLRQALETKFARLIGVGFYNSLYATPRLDHSFHYNFIKSNSQHFTFKNVDFGLLKQIYDWCNEIVHGAYRPHIWLNAYAHSTCRGLFHPPSTAPGAGWSINGSVEINDLSLMQSTFIEEFFKTYREGVWGIEMWEPEAIIVS